MNSQNICKFIIPQEKGILTANNFIFESKVPHSGKSQTCASNIIYIVSSGEGCYKIADSVYRLKAGYMFFSFADIPFVIENLCNLEYYYISFCGSRSEELFERFGVNPKACVFTGYDGLLPLWKESLARADAENIDLLSESIILYTFSKFKNSTVKKDVGTLTLSYMEKHFTDSDLSLQSISEALGYNQKYLSNTFKKTFGISFSEHLRTMRINYSVTLIENGVTSIKNIAALSGFSDPLYFSKVFRDTVGITPSEYKKRA